MNPPRSAVQRVVGVALGIATLGLAAAVAASFAARLNWALDLATHFRMQYAIAGLLLTGVYVVLRRFRAAAIPLVLAAINGWFVGVFYFPQPEPGPPPADARHLKIIALNVFAGSQAYDDVIAYIRTAQPDVVIFSELTPAWQAGLKPLEAEYPERHFTARQDPFGIGLIAKIPLKEIEMPMLTGNLPYVRATFEVDNRSVTVFGVHPPPPMTPRLATLRNDGFAALNKLVREAQGSVIVAGDFNSTSWSPHFADLLAGTNLRDSRLGRGLQPSWSMTHPAPLHIPIDHILVSPEVHVFERRLGPKVGSDHLPVELEFGLRP